MLFLPELTGLRRPGLVQIVPSPLLSCQALHVSSSTARTFQTAFHFLCKHLRLICKLLCFLQNLAGLAGLGREITERAGRMQKRLDGRQTAHFLLRALRYYCICFIRTVFNYNRFCSPDLALTAPAHDDDELVDRVVDADCRAKNARELQGCQF